MTRPLPRNRLPTLLIALSPLLLSGCHEETTKPITSCGVYYQYDKKTEQQAAREYLAMQTASTFPVTRQLLDDYGETRQSIRDCK